MEWTELRREQQGRGRSPGWEREQGAHHDRLHAELFKHVVPNFTLKVSRRDCAAGTQGSLDLEEETEDSGTLQAVCRRDR